MDSEVGRTTITNIDIGPTVTNLEMWPITQIVEDGNDYELLVFLEPTLAPMVEPITVIVSRNPSRLAELAENAVNKGIWVDDVLYPGRRVHRCEIRLVGSEQTPAG